MKYFLCIFVIVFLSCCIITSKVDYNELMIKQLNMIPLDSKNQLNELKVIILGDPTFVDTTIIKGQHVSNVIISDMIISDPEKRYYIGHLIRNILIKDAIIYNIDGKGNNFTMDPVVEISDDFIYINKDLICEVIYYLCHKNYFNLVGNPGGSGEKIFFTPLLQNIDNELKQIRIKLEEENALMLIYLDIIVKKYNY